MFSFIRRISGSVLPRADRPWDDDATSNAPRLGKKRKLSMESINEGNQTMKKKSKPMDENPAPTVVAEADKNAGTEPQVSSSGSQPVKDVTSGVAKVELEDHQASENIPLPTQDDAEVEALQEAAPEISLSSVEPGSPVPPNESPVPENATPSSPKPTPPPEESPEQVNPAEGEPSSSQPQKEEIATEDDQAGESNHLFHPPVPRPIKPLPAKGRKAYPPLLSSKEEVP